MLYISYTLAFHKIHLTQIHILIKHIPISRERGAFQYHREKNHTRGVTKRYSGLIHQTHFSCHQPTRLHTLDLYNQTLLYLALLARDGRVARLSLTHLALHPRVARLLILVDDVLHGPILGQIVGTALVEVDRLLANGAREAEGAARRRETAIARGADVATRPWAGRRAAAHHAGVGLRQDRQFVGFLVGAGRVRRVDGRLWRWVRRRLQIHRARQA